MKRLALIVTVAILATCWCARRIVVQAATPQSLPSGPELILHVDGNGQGRTFEGVGGQSAGAASRFLIDYPEPYRSQILDYLFKPHYGASLERFRVEIGGDTNSTWGSEPSHMHSRDDQNYHRGYEWWLMTEARKRNPNIPLGLLPWGAPGWIGNHHFYSRDMIDYELKFINAAHDTYGLNINTIGIWNETAYDKEWIKALKNAVVENNAHHGLNTSIVAADDVATWQLAKDMNADPALMAAIDAIGVHYPAYVSSSTAQHLQRNGRYVPLWDSEDSYSICPQADYANLANPLELIRGAVICLGRVPPAVVLAKMLNRNYVDGKMTAMIHCTIAAAFPAFLQFKEGLVLATSPWSGHYEVSPALWAVAHTTQFAQPGWQYIDSASGYLRDADSRVVGSYVTLKSPNHADYSIIIETTDARTARKLKFEVTNGLSSRAVHVWHSNIKAGTYFVREADLDAGDTHSLTLEPASIYSLTTTTGQQKGDPGAIPPDSAQPFPFSNNFEDAALNRSPKYFVDQEGSFEVGKCTGRPGKCMIQMVDQPPIPWMNKLNARFPFTFLGDEIGSRNWKDYQVSLDVLMEKFGSVTLWGRLDHLIPCSESKWECQLQKVPDGYSFSIDRGGRWKLNKSFHDGAIVTPIKSGALTGWPPMKWHHLKLAFRGSTLNVLVDGRPVVSNYADSGPTHAYGMVALSTEWTKVEFDNFCLSKTCP